MRIRKWRRRARRSPTTRVRRASTPRSPPGGGVRARAPLATDSSAKPLDSTLAAVGGDPSGGRGGFCGFRPGGPPPPTFVGVSETLRGLFNAVETGDIAPTQGMEAAYAAACKDLARAATTFNGVVAQHQLKQAAVTAPSCGAVVPRARARPRAR